MTESETDKRYHRVKAKLPDGTEYEALIGKTPEDGAIFTPYIPESVKKSSNRIPILNNHSYDGKIPSTPTPTMEEYNKFAIENLARIAKLSQQTSATSDISFKSE